MDGHGADVSDTGTSRINASIMVIFLCLVTICCIVGNILVIAAVASSNVLRSSVTNYFVASLAVADLTVAVCVMPFAIVVDWRAATGLLNGSAPEAGDTTTISLESYDLFTWIFCNFWMSCDVMCCTASILNLCIISVDRYLAITEPLSYSTCMSTTKGFIAIGAAWVCSGAISFIPIYSGWFGDENLAEMYSDLSHCGLQVNRLYAVMSSMTSFYIPLCVMITVYAKIYRVASRQANQIAKQERSLMSSQSRLTGLDTRDDTGTSTPGSTDSRRRIIKERKAIRTLGTIMGLFCFCWLPFFLLYLIEPFCPSCHVPYWVRSSITWLGYCNSGINPFVYALMNKEFRNAYSRLLFCGKRTQFKSSLAHQFSKKSKHRTTRSHNSFDSDTCLNKSQIKLSTGCPAIRVSVPVEESAVKAPAGRQNNEGTPLDKLDVVNNYLSRLSLSSCDGPEDAENELKNKLELEIDAAAADQIKAEVNILEDEIIQ